MSNMVVPTRIELMSNDYRSCVLTVILWNHGRQYRIRTCVSGFGDRYASTASTAHGGFSRSRNGALGVSDQRSTTELRIHLVNFVCLYIVYHTVEIVSTDSTENLKILGNIQNPNILKKETHD